MASVSSSPPGAWTVADLGDRFGAMPLARLRFVPWPGTATEQDVLDIHRRERRLCELVDGVLVEKTMGLRESCLAIFLGSMLKAFAARHKLGTVGGEAGMMRLAPGLVRIPDLSFISWDRFPERRIPEEAIPDLAPNLAVEILSSSNTREEMKRKLLDYFTAGCQLVWIVDTSKRTVSVHTSADQATVLTENQTLDGGIVLPGFTLSLAELFSELDAH
jgi:Uma2 family endonuclease